MTGDVYKGVTVVGTSTESFSEAIRRAVDRATQTISELRWFEIRDQRGAVRNGQIEYQVTMEVFFKLKISDTGEE
ncbi:MAG TPA: dodecin [Blastocatellia bacterium]|nr:dodecin [Blastocatellia bacterium]